jgi:hypothetical protein
MERSEFLRIFPLRAKGLMWFTGAGASAGIKTAGNMVWDFKQQIFCAEQKITVKSCPNLSDLAFRARLNQYFKTKGGYLIDFKGFSSTFGIRVTYANVHIPIAATIDGEMAASERPHMVLAEHLTRAVSALKNARSSFDVVVLYLPERWSSGYRGREDDFDLHDYLKGVTATASIPTQVLLERGAFEFKYRCSVMWRLSIALYTKAGGIPWKLAHVNPEVAFIGLGYP